MQTDFIYGNGQRVETGPEPPRISPTIRWSPSLQIKWRGQSDHQPPCGDEGNGVSCSASSFIAHHGTGVLITVKEFIS